jgi:hypothetical protein
MELDFILHTRGIVVDSFSVPEVTFSDHRPLVCDFHVTGTVRAPRGRRPVLTSSGSDQEPGGPRPGTGRRKK